MIGIIVSGGLSFLFVIVSTFLGVKFFKSRNIGQNIQEEVVFHEHKKGTPTMGGIFVILGTIFGIGLVISEMINPVKVLGFLNIFFILKCLRKNDKISCYKIN